MPAARKKSRKKAPAAKKRRGSKPSRDDTAFERLTAQKLERLLEELHRLYPDADCELLFDTPLDLLVATILSAQSTDKRVNEVTRSLFKKYRTAADYAAADPSVFEEEIHSTGFFRNKTKSVLGAAKKLVAEHGGEVPDTMEELVELPGVARKTANVVLGTAFKKPIGVVVDTHIKRLSYRLGLTAESDPLKIERDLMELLPQSEWIFAGHAIIWHGRRVCDAKKPACEVCTLAELCPKNGV